MKKRNHKVMTKLVHYDNHYVDGLGYSYNNISVEVYSDEDIEYFRNRGWYLEVDPKEMDIRDIKSLVMSVILYLVGIIALGVATLFIGGINIYYNLLNYAKNKKALQR
jgi:hypothetical protein